MSDLPSLEQLVELLNVVLSGDNQKIGQVSKVLKKYTKLPDSVGPLVQIYQQSPNVGLKQLSIMMIRKNIAQVYQQLNQQAQTELKAFLLTAFMSETVSVIRKQLGFTIGIIAQQTLSKGQWNELYQVLEQQTDQTMDVQKRKSGIILLGTILDYSGEALKEFYGSFYNFFAASIQDSCREIKVETVRCLVILFDNVVHMTKDQVNKYKELINPLLNVLDQMVQEEDEDNVHQIFDGFSYLAETKITMLDQHFKVIIEYCCSKSILHNDKLPFILKETVCDLIYTIAENHRGVFNKNVDLMKKVVESCCLIISTPLTQEQIEDNKGQHLSDDCLWLLLMLAMHLNKKKMYGILLQAITALIGSGNAHQMAAGYSILGQISEACADQIIRNLSNPIMNDFIPKGVSSQFPEVRGACVKALGYFAEWIGGSIIEYHNIILPAVIACFNDLNQSIQERAMITLDVFCDSMEEEQILAYLPELIPKMIQVPYLQVSIKTKRAAISCIASCISTSAKGFRNYIPTVYKLLHELILSQETPETDVLKAEAIGALGKIANHFSKDDPEVHSTVIAPCMEKIYDLLVNYGSHEINEGCFSFFYSLAEALGTQFEQLFDKIIEITLKKAVSNEGVQYKKDQGEFSLDTDSEEDETEGATQASIKQGFLDEKGAAIHALGEFAVACPMKFQNYFERAFAVLEEVFNYFHDNIRQQAMICYRDLCIGMVKCSNGGELPVFDKGLPVTKQLDNKVAEVMGIEIWTKFCHTIRHDKENEIVSQTIECVESLIKKIGPAYIHTNLDDLYDVILDLLEGRCECQINDPEEDEDEETDGLVFECLTDLIPTIAESLQGGFELGFQKLFPSIMAYTNTDRDMNFRVQMIGSFCEIFDRGHSNLIQLSLEHLLPRLLNGVTENDDELSRNTVYCLGLMVQKGKQFLSQENFQNIMIALKYVFENSQDQACKDNTASSLCRIMVAAPDMVPFEAAMDSILAIAPFKGDPEEEQNLLKCIVTLSGQKGEYMQKNIQKVIALFVDGISQLKLYQIESPFKEECVAFVKQLAGQYKDIVEACVMSLEETQKNIVIALLQ